MIKKRKKSIMLTSFFENMKERKIWGELIIGFLTVMGMFIVLCICERRWVQIICLGVFLFGIRKTIDGLVKIVYAIHDARRKGRYGRTFNEIGQECFQFDFALEKNIYSHLCRLCFVEDQKQKLEITPQIEKYKEWKKHIVSQYKQYGPDELTEFSKYLNQMSRNLKPDSEFLKTFFAVMLALVIEEVFGMVLKQGIDYSDLNIAGMLLVDLTLAIVVLAVILIFTAVAIKPIVRNDMEQNFVADYKEIIDELIETKQRKTSQESNGSTIAMDEIK